MALPFGDELVKQFSCLQCLPNIFLPLLPFISFPLDKNPALGNDQIFFAFTISTLFW